MAEFMSALEIIGTVAFAVSGALVAVGANLDFFGVIFLGVVTAIGGGIMRDIMIGNNPPLIFDNAILFVIAILVSVTIFVIAYIFRKNYSALRTKLEVVNNLFDALGLAVFTVSGVEIGYLSGVSDNVLILVVIGMFTGVGGGIIRDVLIDTTPFIFRKHIYALASIIGSVTYIILRGLLHSVEISSLIAMAVIFVIRLLSTIFRWKLPKIRIDEAD